MGEEIFRRECTDGGAEFLKIHWLDSRYPVRTFFSTRVGGCSSGSFTSLNMGYATGDDRAKVTENRRRIFDFIGQSGYYEAVPYQVHKAEIVCIRTDGEGLQALREGKSQEEAIWEEVESCEKRGGKLCFPDTDAVITDAKNVILTSLHADCIPVWLYDPKHHSAGLAHAGWRGTKADIAAKTAEKMCREFDSRKEDMIAVIGPGISRCCFEVGEEVIDVFASVMGADEFFGSDEKYYIDDKNGKFHLDLKAINAYLLERAGISQILITDYCTYCREDLFYSYRRDDGVTGRMCAGIMLL